MRWNVGAWTSPEPAPPGQLVPFISINQDHVDEVIVTVRQANGALAEIVMRTADFRKLARDAYAGTSEHQE